MRDVRPPCRPPSGPVDRGIATKTAGTEPSHTKRRGYRSGLRQLQRAWLRDRGGSGLSVSWTFHVTQTVLMRRWLRRLMAMCRRCSTATLIRWWLRRCAGWLVGLAAPLSVNDASLMFAAPPHSRSRQRQLQPQPARSMGRQASRPSPRPTPTAGHTRHRTKPLRRVRHRRRVPPTPTKPRRRMSAPAFSRRPLRRVINPPNRCDQRAGHSTNIRATTGQTDFYESPTEIRRWPDGFSSER